ncbi:rhomboid-related protein 2-like [Diabrotica virgifera virgifera]|uniref:Rhomboid-related protein 2-like n=1 Tax=Diabrotica virgifera virgifera TaxID=50390 RepID=A0A6P7G5C8_DIAVI|nr:rhomboid-related protein 2-like [Diabrotica virgifera virgifera]XP_050500272.1 rhomboid-related protein 2-like [Diabrotica virgifera virgifera]XP_050500273.1 rhomboid-related protein 2-like [Diabrotica virgifera virgifera]
MARNDPENIPMDDVGYIDSRKRQIFEQCDTDGDGYITLDELAKFISDNETSCACINPRAIKKIYQNADKDKDHKLSFQEFVDFVESEAFQSLVNRCITTYIHHLIPHPKQAVSLRAARSGGRRGSQGDLCDEYSCFPPPVFMLLISILEFALFITDELTQEGSSLTATGVTGRYLLYDPDKKKEVWRFVTYMFVHIGYNHIITNLVVQLALGIPLEMVNKWWRVLLVYFLGGIAGSLAHSIIDGNIRLGGASGGVYALMTAHLAQVIMNWDSLRFASVQLVVFGLIISIDLGTASYQRYFKQELNGIGVTCHLGGAVAGLLVGIYVLRNIHQTTFEKYIWWAALVVYILLMIGALIATILM